MNIARCFQVQKTLMDILGIWQTWQTKSQKLNSSLFHELAIKNILSSFVHIFLSSPDDQHKHIKQLYSTTTLAEA